MSIFSNNLVESPKILFGYKLYGENKPGFYFLGLDKNMCNHVIEESFSKIKISNKINSLNTRNDGTKILSQNDFKEFDEKYNFKSYNFTPIIKGLYWVLLLSEGFDSQYLSNIYTSLLRDNKLRRGGNVKVDISVIGVRFFVVSIQVNTELKTNFKIVLVEK